MVLKDAAITVAQRLPVTQHPDPDLPYPALGNPRVCPTFYWSSHNSHRLDFAAVLLGRNLGSDPVSSSPPRQPTPKRLGFCPSSTATHSKTSPSHPQARSHSRLETAAYRDLLVPIMSSVASSSAVTKVHTSPSKVSLGGVYAFTRCTVRSTALDSDLRRQTGHPGDA